MKIRNITKTDNNIITYSWTMDEEISHKISGHLFEAIDYFLSLGIFAQQNTIILIPDESPLRIEQINKVIKDKYKEEYHELLQNKIIFGRPKVLITTKDITVCDGIPPKAELVCDTLQLWLCSKDYWWASVNRLNKNTFNTLKINYFKSIHMNVQELKDKIQGLKLKGEVIYDNKFIKLIYPDNYKVPKWSLDEFKDSTIVRVLIYATGNCRSLGKVQETGIDIKNDLHDAFTQIKERLNKEIHVIYAGANSQDEEILDFLREDDLVDALLVYSEDQLPIEDLHDKFDLYLYTPTSKNWDCSPRLVKECFFYKKMIMFCSSVVHNLKDNTGLKTVYEYIRKH